MRKQKKEGNDVEVLFKEKENEEEIEQEQESFPIIEQSLQKLQNQEQPLSTNENHEQHLSANEQEENLKQIEIKSQQQITEDSISLTLKSSEFNLENEEDYQKRCHSIYSLHTVFIHKGSAQSGHYYAYIKSFENHKWYRFDDNHVQEVPIGDVLKDGYGGEGSEANAYMLVYHKLTLDVNEQHENKTFEKSKNDPPRKQSGSLKNLPEKNDKNELDLEFIFNNTKCPEYMRVLIEQEMKQEEMKNKIKVSSSTPRIISHRVFFKLEVKVIKVGIDSTFKQFFQFVLSKFDLTDEEKNNCRLRLYNKLKDEMLDTFENKEENTISQLKLIAQKNFIIEIKQPSESFTPYNSNIINLNLFFWNE